MVILRSVNMGNKIIGALIGFSTGLYVALVLAENLSYITYFHKEGLLLVCSITITTFCFVGIYFMSDRKNVK
jgi:hypothetical protein